MPLAEQAHRDTRIRSARLHITPLGYDCRVEIGDVDISSAVRGIQISADVKGQSSVTLDLVLIEGIEVDGETRVLLPAKTVDALCALGWTPPPAAPEITS